MNTLRLATIALAVCVATAAFAQERAKISPEDKALSDKMWAMVQATPVAAMDRIELHPKVTLEGISAVAGDKQGNVYVIHRPTAKDADPIVKVNAKGDLVASWGKGMYVIPHGIRVDPDGNVWTLDANTSKVFKYSPDGKQLMVIEVGEIPDAKQAFCGVTDIAFSPAGNGHVFIGDGYCNSRVLEYDAGGKRVRSWGKAGSGPGEFKQVHSVAIGPDGNIYVGDRRNGRVQWFDLTGKYLGEHKYGGEVTSIAIGPNGVLYASLHPAGLPFEQDNAIVSIDLKTGKFTGRIDTRAHQVSVAPDGTVLPATRDGQITIYRPRK
jgi:WD40 repeat protein